MRFKYGVPVAFGNHCSNLNILYTCLGYEPSDIFFYAKGTDEYEYPDNEHSVPLNKVREMAENIKRLSTSFGDGRKYKMKNNIEGQR